jgi:hypothetical protein
LIGSSPKRQSKPYLCAKHSRRPALAWSQHNRTSSTSFLRCSTNINPNDLSLHPTDLRILALLQHDGPESESISFRGQPIFAPDGQPFTRITQRLEALLPDKTANEIGLALARMKLIGYLDLGLALVLEGVMPMKSGYRHDPAYRAA